MCYCKQAYNLLAHLNLAAAPDVFLKLNIGFHCTLIVFFLSSHSPAQCSNDFLSTVEVLQVSKLKPAHYSLCRASKSICMWQPSVYCGENEESQTNKKEHIKGVDIYYK